MYNTVWRVCWRQLKSALGQPRVWLACLIGIGVAVWRATKVVGLSSLAGQPLQLSEPAFACLADRLILTLLFMAFLLLSAEVPYGSAGDLFILMRVGRNRWIAGKILYIFCLCLLYTAVICAAAALTAVTVSFPGNVWSYPFYQLMENGIGDNLLSLSGADPELLHRLTPWAALLCASGLWVLYLFFNGLLLCLCNLGKSRVWGFALAGGLHALVFCDGTQKFSHLLPLAHVSPTELWIQSFWGTSRCCGVGESFLYFAALCTVLIVAVAVRTDKVDLSHAIPES